MNYLIGVDLGTSGLKPCCLIQRNRDFQRYGRISYVSAEKRLGRAGAGGLVGRHHADTNKKVIEDSGVDSKDIKGMGISGQMHGLVMLDENGSVLRRSIIWCDQRTARECEEITERVGAKRLIEITANPALPGFTASKILWVETTSRKFMRNAGTSFCRRIMSVTC